MAKEGHLFHQQSNEEPRMLLAWQKLKLKDLIARLNFKALIQEHAKQILMYAYFKISEAKAGYLFQEWCENQFKPYAITPMSSQGLSRWTKLLEKMQQNRTSFFKQWAKHRQKDHALWFDLTSFPSYSAQNSWCEWGYHRDNESLPQVNLGMVMGMQGLPLFYQTYPGSIIDVSTLKILLIKLKIERLVSIRLSLIEVFIVQVT